MLIYSRTKMANKKLSTTVSLQSNSILSTNPQIQRLVDKFLLISDGLPEDKQTTLNLINWEKEKYRPNQNQNRIRIENQISLLKVCNQKVRSRAKPIKRALSIDYSRDPSSKPYKEHYEEIKQTFNLKPNNIQPSQSQQQCEIPTLSAFPIHQKGGIKYYQNLKKYDRIIQFIQDRRQIQSQKKLKGLKSYYSQTIPTSPRKGHDRLPTRKLFSMTEDKYMDFKDKQSSQKVSSLIRKWKPASKMQKIFKQGGQAQNRVHRKRNKTSLNLQSKTQALMKLQSSLSNENNYDFANTQTQFQNY